MPNLCAVTECDAALVAQTYRWPRDDDHKYSRGVLGVYTGSSMYPGAAVLGTGAAIGTGLGMVRYLGGERAAAMVLARTPEVVCTSGRTDAWLVGSGTDAAHDPEALLDSAGAAMHSGRPVVVDAGALDLVDGPGPHPWILTPHAGECAKALSRLTGETIGAGAVTADPLGSAARLSKLTGAVVLIKGHETFVVTPAGAALHVDGGPAWLATAGSGDVLGGVIGAVLTGVAAHGAEAEADQLAAAAAAGAWIHAQAGAIASAGERPISALAIVDALPEVVARLSETAQERKR